MTLLCSGRVCSRFQQLLQRQLVTLLCWGLLQARLRAMQQLPKMHARV
jgi:hypothetical protein